MSQKTIIETVNQIASYAKSKGIAHLATQDINLDNNIITVGGKKCVNFGSCSYLGLEFNNSVKESAKKAIDAYGTQFSSSRAYVSPKFYVELENKLEQIFSAPTVVTPTTTLGHMAAIPTLVSQNDVIILDHQVHNSVQTAASLLKAKGTKVELIRHNRMDLLEKRINELKNKHENIWYMADGIYSMYGDAAPLDEVYELMDKYSQLRFYVDDAHGMSCYGDKGQGYVLAERKIHKQMVVATSFAKAYATGGGALIFPNREMAQLVRNCGGPLITSGPMQPAALGAACAVADLHLSGEIKKYQEDLKENILFANLMLKKYNLPNLAESFSPIFFVAVSLPKIAYKVINRVKNDGHFLNIGIFPAVPIKNTGVRFTITRLHTFEQIEQMIKSLAKNFENVLKEEKVELNDIYKAFKIKSQSEAIIDNKVRSLINSSNLIAQKFSSICEIPQNDWNEVLNGRGTFDWNGLKLLEDSFQGNAEKYENWDFDYLIVKDFSGKIVLATFLTTAWIKDDLLMKGEVSSEIEKKRLNDPYYMTSKTISVGSPLTEGNHLYIDKTSPYWKEALDKLMELIGEIQEKRKATNVIIRDLADNDPIIDDYMFNNGLFRVNIPENCKIQNIEWTNEEELYASLSRNGKRHYRKNVIKSREYFDVKIQDRCTDEELSDFYELYELVKGKSLDINTFKLPYKLFEKINQDTNWEILSLYLAEEIDPNKRQKPVAMAVCHKGTQNYTFVLAGINYEYNTEFSCYRQLLAQIVLRGRVIGSENIHLGYTSEIEKKRFGAKLISSCAYMQVKDNFNLEAMEIMSISKKREDGVNERRILSI